jgi:cobalt-zinc-cadmium resistance protein CzcA
VGRLVEFALSQRLLVLLAIAVLAGAGYVAMRQLPIDAFPDVSTTQVKVILKAPGMTPEEVEAGITVPIEMELMGIPKQTLLRSVVKYGLTDITVDFREGTDIYWARQQVAERLSGVWDKLPSGLIGGIAPPTTPLGEMFMFTVEGDVPLMERRDLLDWVVRPALRNVPGVADVNVLGGLAKTYEVVPDVAAMNARGIGLNRLKQALESNNRNDGAGRISEGEEAVLVRVEGRIKDARDIRGIVVATINGTAVRVGDIATVRINSLTRYGAVSENGKGEAVEGLVLGLRGANARQVVDGVRAKLDEITPSLPSGVSVKVFYDRGDLVARAVHTVTKALAEATVLVLVLLVLFLGNLRAALTVALALPLAALITFILMRVFGLSANLMSLGGLAIAIGMLVDAAVVVVENVVTHLSKEEAGKRLPRLHVIYRAAREISVPVTSGILIIIIVFLPLVTLQGLEGKLFIPVALTISFALGGSLLISLTAIPVLSSLLLGKISHEEPWLVRHLHRLYAPVLRWCLAHGRTVTIAALVALVATALAYTRIGKTFMPTMDEGDVIVQLEKLPSINLTESVHLDMHVQQAILKNVPEVKRIVARVGSDEIGLDPMGLNETDSFFVLAPRDEWKVPSKDALLGELRRVLGTIPGVAFGFTQPIEMRVAEMLTGTRGDLAIKVFGPDIGVLNDTADAIVKVVSGIPGAEEVLAARNEGVQYLRASIDRLAAGRFGLQIDELQSILRAQVEGLPVGIVQDGVRRVPILLRGPASLNAVPANFVGQQIALPDGRLIPLSAVVKFERVEGPVLIARERGARMVVVRANVTGRDLVGFVEEAKRAVAADVKLPPGYYLEWGGQFENQQRAAKRLAIVVPIAIGLIFLLLFSTFGSVRQAVLVLSNIPFAMIGGVFALWLSGEYLSVPASVGFIALLGIAVLNGVVLVSYFNQLRAHGMAMAEVVVEGASRRLRPVLMTASIAAFGLAPLLLATGPGSEIQRPLAVVVIGGLVSSTLLTLILLPILYRQFGEAGAGPGGKP